MFTLKNTIIIIALFSLTFSAFPALSADQQNTALIPDPLAVQAPSASPAIEEKPFNEGLGLYASPQQGSLGPSLWQGLPREDIYKLIDSINPTLTSPSLRALALRLLLTQTDPLADPIKSDAAPPLPDFLTYRMTKLNHLGAYEDASHLYEKTADQKLSGDLAEAGLTALIGNNRTSVACLESKVHSEATSDHPFWAQLAQLCKGLVGKPLGTNSASAVITSVFSDASFKFKPASWAEINALSLVERGAVISQGRLDYAALLNTPLTLENIDALIQVFYDPTLPPAIKVRLAAFLTSHGFLNVKQLQEIYVDLGKPLVLEGKPPSTSWEKLIVSYVKLLPPAARPNEKAIESPFGPAYDALLSETLLLKQDFGLQALLPLKAALENYATPEALPEESFKTGLAILLTSQSEKTSFWLEKSFVFIDKNTEKSNEYIPYLMSAYSLGAPLPEKRLTYILSDDGFLSDPDRYAMIALAASYGEGNLPFSEDPNKKYVKENLLTGLTNYVMHDGAESDSYAKILKSKHLGKVALAAILALQEKPVGELSPKTLKSVLDGLNSVGLDDVARHVLTESLLQREFIETGESQQSLETETKENQNHGTSRPPSTTEAGSTSEH